MRLNDPGKLIVLVTLLVCATVLLGIGKLDTAVFNTLIGVVTGYLFGNGRLATRNKTTTGLFAPKDDSQ